MSVAVPVLVSGPRREPGEEASVMRVFLPAGGMVISEDPCVVTTILGSCVAVCLWDGERQIGGVTHYVLPRAPASATGLARYGDAAIGGLVGELMRLGAQQATIQAKVYGGGCVLAAFRGIEDHIGHQNATIARAMLTAERIRVVDCDVGGEYGRKIRFRTDNGAVSVKRI